MEIERDNQFADALQSALASKSQVESVLRKLARDNAHLSKLAATDELTGLPNRRTAMNRMTEAWSFSLRHGVPLSAVLVDIDHFKVINDTYGHSVGDLVLQRTAEYLRTFARVEDVIFRFGGEEFLILCPHTPIDGATMVAERVRRVIESNKIHHAEQVITITLSAGVAERTDEMPDAENLLKAADRALYVAKRKGRNHVCYDGEHGPDDDIFKFSQPDESQHSPAEAASSRQVTVFMLDLNEQSRSTGAHLLGQHGYKVEVSDDPEAALDQISRTRPDVAIVQEHLPELDAVAYVHKLKTNPATQDLPVLLVGSRMDREAFDAAMFASADEYLAQPMSPAELLLRVRSLVQLSHSRRELADANEIRSEQARMLALVLEYTRSLAGGCDLDVILDQTVAVTAELTFSSRVSIMLPDADRKTLFIARAIGLDEAEAATVKVPVGSGIAGQVFETQRSVVINEQNAELSNRSGYDSVFYASVPMTSTSDGSDPAIIGVLNVSNRHAGRPFEPRELEFIDLISNISASAINEVQIRRATDEARQSALAALANLAEKRDGSTGRHLDRVTAFCVLLARQLQTNPAYTERINEHFIDDLRRAVPLHDVGKIAVPDEVLLKPGKLTGAELAVMRRHVQVGCDTLDMLRAGAPEVRFFEMARHVAAAHHEWFDGNGYPNRLSGGAIPIEARLAVVADAYDAITSRRSYKEAFSHETAIQLLHERAGTQFDPEVIEALDRCEQELKSLALDLAEDETVERSAA